MYGVSMSRPSRTTALCATYVATVFWLGAWSWPAWPALTRPRLYSPCVMRLNSCEPWRVNWIATIGWPVFASTSALVADPMRSLPVRAGGSLSRYQYLPFAEAAPDSAPGQAAGPLHQTGSELAGTLSTTVCDGCFPPL